MNHVNVWEMSWSVWQRFRDEADTLVAQAAEAAQDARR